MIKIYFCAIFVCVPGLGYADMLKNYALPQRLNLEVRSTNTCSYQPTIKPKEDYSAISSTSYLYTTDLCRNSPTPLWRPDPPINNEVTTWLRLKGGQSKDTRMIGLGFRFQVAGDGVAHIRIKSSGGVQFRLRTTF